MGAQRLCELVFVCSSRIEDSGLVFPDQNARGIQIVGLARSLPTVGSTLRLGIGIVPIPRERLPFLMAERQRILPFTSQQDPLCNTTARDPASRD